MNWRNKPPTEKQLEYIKALSNQYGCEFIGTTRGEACDFLDHWGEIDHREIQLESWYFEALHENAGDRI